MVIYGLSIVPDSHWFPLRATGHLLFSFLLEDCTLEFFNDFLMSFLEFSKIIPKAVVTKLSY